MPYIIHDYIRGLRRALNIMEYHDRFPDDYLTGIHKIRELVRKLEAEAEIRPTEKLTEEGRKGPNK